jgi:hypothetical protein
MKTYKLEPISKLTPEIIDRMIIHTGVSSLRRAASNTPCMKRIEGNEKLPTLYYLKGVIDPTVNDWNIHALIMDINKYLLMDTVSSSDDPEVNPDVPIDPVVPEDIEFVRSVIRWDGITGKTSDDIWVDPYLHGENNEELRFKDSVLAYYEASEEIGRVAGHRVGVVITPDQRMLAKYPNAKVYIEKDDKYLTVEEAFYEYEEAGFTVPAFYYYPLILTPGQENVVRIIWTDELEESFPVIIEQSCVLEAIVTEASDEESLVKAVEAGEDVILTAPIVLGSTLEVTKPQRLDLNNQSITGGLFGYDNGAIVDGSSESYAIWAKEGSDIVIEGEGEVNAQSAEYSMAIWSQGGKVTIKGGRFTNEGEGSDLIYASEGGVVDIYGGEFIACKMQEGVSGTKNAYTTLNVKDRDRSTSNITVYGGKFLNFNPINNLSEGEGTTFVADGYTVMVDGVENHDIYTPDLGDVWYEVVKA